MTRLVWTLPDGQQTARWAEDQSVGGDSLGLFNVIDYGAVGDGTTDDTAACQAAITAANAYAAAHGTAVVYFPTRTFLFDTPSYGYSIMSPTSGVSLVGAGTLKASGNHGNQIIVDIGGYTGAVVDGLSFDGTDTADNLSIRVSASFYAQIRNCTFDNIGTSAVYISGAAEDTTISGCVMRGGLYQILWHDDSTATRTKIVGNTFDGLGELSEAIEINTPTGSATHTEIVGNTFNDFLYNGSNTVACVGIAHATGVLISGNTFTNCNTRAVHIEDGSGYVNITGNRFVNNGREAIYLVLGSASMARFLITGNMFTTCGTNGYSAVYFVPGGDYSPFSIINVSSNVFWGCGKAASATSSIQADGYLSTAVISNNTIHGTLGNTSGLGNGITIAGNNASGSILISGNLIAGGANGIILSGAQSVTTVRNNSLGGNSTNSFNSSATGTITVKDNDFYTTAAENGTSVADGGTVTHGLVATPTVVTVSGSVASEIVSVTAKSSTTFTVAIKKDDGTAGTTQTVYWRATV